MNIRLTTIVAAFLISAVGSAPSFARPADDLAPKADRGAVFDPVVRLTNGCTGFHIGNGIFLSAGHCMGMKTAWSLETENDNGGKRSFKVDTMIYSNPNDWNAQDTAIIYVEPILTKALPALDLDCSGTVHPIGTEIATEGFPEDYGRNYTVGYISAKPSPHNKVWQKAVYRAQLPISYGNSGGPVFDLATGKVIGVMVGLLPNNRTLSIVQPIDFACRVLGRSE